jgi:queuine tRNA-ribosyltransferase
MFDCVMPTRNARNGTVFTMNGKLTVKAASYSHDYRPIDENCNCLCCRNYSRSYLRHLLNVGEIAGLRLLTIHNIEMYLELTRRARKAILADKFAELKKELYTLYSDESENV